MFIRVICGAKKNKLMTRGIRNNNPLNIRRSADRWQGASEQQTDKSFVQFKTMAYGYRAAWKILQSYFDRFFMQGKPYTVRNIIERWAPPKENDTEAYIRHVLKSAGIGGRENLLLPLNVTGYDRLCRILVAMTCMECGIAPQRGGYGRHCPGLPSRLSRKCRQTE